MGDSSANLLRISGGALSETEDEKDIYIIENGRESKVGSTTERLKFVLINGRDAIEREQTLISDVLGNRKGITIIEKSSVRPISFTDYLNGNLNVRAEYGNDEVHITSGDDRKTIKLKGNCFDTFSIELILRVLPLKAGYSLHLNGFNATIESDVAIYIQVLELERVNRGLGDIVDAWKVKTNFGDTIQFYWIDITRKELLKQSSEIGDGLILEFRRRQL
ncbi:MAG: hypothetical protein ACQEWE_18970 [Bacillota bacterium]